MADRIGLHYFGYDKAGNLIPSTGYPGKSFIAFGAARAYEVFTADIVKRSEVAARVNLGATRRTKAFSNGRVEVSIVSDLTDYLERFRIRMLKVAIDSLEVAGSVGVQASIDEFERKLKGTTSGKNTGDTTDIPSNIGFEIFTEGNNIFGVRIGSVRPSIKMLAQEYGLYPGE